MAGQRTPHHQGVVAATIQTLESLAGSGVEQLPKPRRRANAQSPEPKNAASSRGMERAPTSAAAPAHGNGSAAEARETAGANSAGLPVVDSWDAIRREVEGCRACDELATTRTQTVFGVGNPRARLCFLGEAPGADEDRQGEPFVGRAGQLLTKIIEACTLQRSEVYILNVLKCRPPGNRTPLPHEVTNCRGFLDRQLRLIEPECICCLGAVAAQTLLQTETPIGRLRGKFFDYQGIAVLCTYHPAYLLRNPAAKKDVWEDMKVLLRRLGVELEKSPPAK